MQFALTLVLLFATAIFAEEEPVQAGAQKLTKNALHEVVEAAVQPANNQGGKQVRVCSCQEETQCLQEMKDQAVSCFNDCFEKDGEVQQLTNNSAQLKTCFTPKERLIDQYIGCLREDPKACAQDKNGPMIPARDIAKVINDAQSRLKGEVQDFQATLSKEGNDLINAGFSVGKCVKQCFMEKNQGAFCFDKISCQPRVAADSTKNTADRCSSRINWGKEMRDICSCSAKAGVEKAKPFCEALNALSDS
ncbi:hypothetical protein Ddc_03684 [Ditylenchus destructor]|nr:hypothetical protein Ddc_03684 [Ditylenchus destructor]